MAEMEAEEFALQSELDAVKVNVDNLSQQELKFERRWTKKSVAGKSLPVKKN